MRAKKGGIEPYAAFGIRSHFEMLRCRVHAHLFAGLVLALELHHAGDLGKKRVVAPFADVHAGMDPRPVLTHDDRARIHLLAVEPLHAEVLRVAVSAVSRTADAFFMSHFNSSGMLLPLRTKTRRNF